MPDLYLYSTPPGATLEMTLDSGEVVMGDPCVANGREDAHRFTLEDDLPTQGAVLHIACDGYMPLSLRGIVAGATFTTDDFHLTELPPPPEPPPPPNPDLAPKDIIDAVYAQGNYDLATHDGCGVFTEAVCAALHDQQSHAWGHIRKTPPQNLYNGHAVDAIQLAGGVNCAQAGIYDIIHDSVSPNGSPAFNHKGPADLSLWYYPA